MRIPKTRHIPGAPPLLPEFTAGALAVVAMVVWLARSSSFWVLGFAVAVALTLNATLLLLLRRVLSGHEPPLARGRRLRRRTLALAGLPALLAPLVAVAVVQAAPRPQGTPVATVRGFLSAAVVNGDGETACAYLTPRAVAGFEGPGHLRTTCESFFGGAALDLGGPITSDAQVDALHYSVAARGPERIVTVSRDGQAMRFVLRPANSAELQEFLAPPTPWRIDSSVSRLGEPASSLGV